jgi:hypothetical protein
MDHPRKSGLLEPPAVTAVEPQQQLEFLSNVQRLLTSMPCCSRLRTSASSRARTTVLHS